MYALLVWPFSRRARRESSEPPIPIVDSRTGEVIDDDYFDRLREKRDQGRVASTVRGRPLWEWIPVIDEHKRRGRLNDARDLTLECITAMESYAAIHEYPSGAAGWYLRAGIIFRKLRDYDGEIAVIDRGLAFMPNNEGLIARRKKAVQLRG